MSNSHSPEKRATYELVQHLNQALGMLFDPELTLFKPDSLPDMIEHILAHYLGELQGTKNAVIQLKTAKSDLIYVPSDTRFTDSSRISHDLNQTVVPERLENVSPAMRDLILQNPTSFLFRVVETAEA